MNRCYGCNEFWHSQSLSSNSYWMSGDLLAQRPTVCVEHRYSHGNNIQNPPLSANCTAVDHYLWALEWRLRDVTPWVTSLISKPQAHFVSDHLLAALPWLPSLPKEPLLPPVVNRMEMEFGVLVGGKALLLMTLRSPGSQLMTYRSHWLCWLNCKYNLVHEHHRDIMMCAGRCFYVKYWWLRGLNGIVLIQGWNKRYDCVFGV